MDKKPPAYPLGYRLAQPAVQRPISWLVGMICLVVGAAECLYRVVVWRNYAIRPIVTESDRLFNTLFTSMGIALVAGGALCVRRHVVGKVILLAWAGFYLAYQVYYAGAEFWSVLHLPHFDWPEITRLIGAIYTACAHCAFPMVVLFLFFREGVDYLKRNQTH